jgi:hypothetical protein
MSGAAKWSRRWLLGGALAAFGLAAAGAAAILPVSGASRRWMVQRVISFYAPGTIFEGDDLEQFAAYVERRILARHIQGLRGLDVYAGLSLPYHSALADRLPEAPATLRSIDQQIMDAFFLSTDFFDENRPPGGRVSMLRSPDPYEAGCSNPLANMTLAANADVIAPRNP